MKKHREGPLGTAQSYSTEKSLHENSQGERQAAHFLGASSPSRDQLCPYLAHSRCSERGSFLPFSPWLLPSFTSSFYQLLGQRKHDFNKGY